MDSKQTVPTWQLSDGELTAALLHAQKTLNQQYGRSIDLVEEAESRGLASCKGYRTTVRFLASALNLSTREAKARVAYTTLPMPLARRELAAGRITCEHMADARGRDAGGRRNTAARTTSSRSPKAVRPTWTTWHCCATSIMYRELHHTEWSMRMVNGVPEFIPPKYLDQEQKPIRNRMHHNLPHEASRP